MINPVRFSESVLMGLARDGGLLLPSSIPALGKDMDRLRRLSYADLAVEVIRPYVDIPEQDLYALIHRSYGTFSHPEVTPVRKVGDVHLLELFHGPTLAFKDVAMQFLGNLFAYLLEKSGRELNIVAATSGDTGSAAIHGVRGKPHIRIFVMYPHGRVSPVQELQMTSVTDANVFNYAVKGTFDDCQRVLKDVFNDLDFRDRYFLGAVNSINWARVLAQIVYYFYAAFRVQEQTGKEQVAFSVPTGNFGDIFAGYVAREMGVPIQRLILATNENDILARFFRTGEYSVGSVVKTLSPSMDIQVASNFERYLYYRLHGNAADVRRRMDDFAKTQGLRLEVKSGEPVDPNIAAGTADTPQTLRVIREYWERHQYLLDPHTAVGVHVAQAFRDPEVPMICLSTAHPAKFPDAIADALGEDIARHPSLDKLRGMPTRREIVEADAEAVKNRIGKVISCD